LPSSPDFICLATIRKTKTEHAEFIHSFQTEDENWDTIPIAVIEREVDDFYPEEPDFGS
jgi:hypothetical protein